jgi:hypothetical protein
MDAGYTPCLLRIARRFTVLQPIDRVTFTGADFSIQHDGVCRMNPKLARREAQLALERCEMSGP